MAGTETPSPSSDRACPSLLGEAPHDLQLRVLSGSLQGETLRIGASKCSVGAGPRCTLRLTGPGTRPLHCIILRGALGTVVRRWSPDTLLNGGAFRDAPLRPGDRLRCGPAEFEVVGPTGAERLGAPPAPGKAVDQPAEGGRQPADKRAAKPAELKEAVRTGRGRARRLVRQLKIARQQCRELQSDLQHERSRRQHAAQQLAGAERVFDGERDGLCRQIESLKASLGQLEQERDRLALKLADRCPPPQSPREEPRIDSQWNHRPSAPPTRADRPDTAAPDPPCDTPSAEPQPHRRLRLIAIGKMAVALAGLLAGALLVFLPPTQGSYGWCLQALGGIIAFFIALGWSLSAITYLRLARDAFEKANEPSHERHRHSGN